MRSTLLAVLLVLGACTDRALDPGATSSDTVDLAGASTRDAAGPLDAAHSPDLAIDTSPGISCGPQHCSVQQACCVAEDGIQCTPLGERQRCDHDEGWRCDGPEDCSGDRICVATFVGQGLVRETRCRRNADEGAVVCHSLSDCPPGAASCIPAQSTVGGGPAIQICSLGLGGP